MRGLKGQLRYGAINIGRSHTLIGVVSGESPFAYAVPISRGPRQWGIRPEVPNDANHRALLTQPDPRDAVTSGPTKALFTVWSVGHLGNSGYVYPDVWINGRAVEGRLRAESLDRRLYMTRAQWTGVARLSRGRNIIVVLVRGSPIRAWAWVLTTR